MDFTSDADKIDLSAFADDQGNALFDAGDINDITTNDDNHVIDLSEHGGGTITVLGVGDGTLGAGDFIFS